MTITATDLRWYQSERMTDTDDGGGQMSAVEIISGVENQIFDDLSDVDRAAGDVSLRKVYALVASAAPDKYLDAGVLVFSPPADPAVSVTAFSTGNFYDQRANLREQLESGISAGARWAGWLWGAHLAGARAINLWQRPGAPLPSAGQRLMLVAYVRAGSTTIDHSQVVWITRVTDSLFEMTDSQGSYSVRSVVCEIAEPLRAAFAGVEPSKFDSQTAVVLYNTRYNQDLTALVGARPLVADAALGDYVATVDTLYSPLIPTALAETALADATPGANLATLVPAASGTITWSTTTDTVRSGARLWLCSSVLPGTLSMVVSGSTITDSGGVLSLGVTPIGTIDYSNGLCTWNDACPAYGTANKVATFRPAATPVRVANTASQSVTMANRGFVWVVTLAPVPQPRTLSVAYRVNNAWYVLFEDGAGNLAGVDSSYGSGRLNYSTGTVTLTVGAMPDVDSEILFAWGVQVNYTPRGGTSVPGVKVKGQTAHPGLTPTTVAVTWTGGSLTDDGSGNLTGTGGTGKVRYSTGDWWVIPTTVPAVNTVFNIVYQYAAQVDESFPSPVRQPDATLHLVLDHEPLPGSVEVSWPVNVLTYAPEVQTGNSPRTGYTMTARDDGAGALPVTGAVNPGYVDYGNKVVGFLPDVTTVFPHEGWIQGNLMTSNVQPDGSVVNTYQRVFNGFQYLPTAAAYESGAVTVSYRKLDTDAEVDEDVTLQMLDVTLPLDGVGDRAVANSVRLRFGNTLYVHRDGVLLANPDPSTGQGTVAGTLDLVTGIAHLTAWTAGGANTVTLEALVTELGAQPVEMVVFRTPTAPIKPGTLQIRYTNIAGVPFTKQPAGSVAVDNDVDIRTDFERGVIRMRHGRWRTVASLTPAELAAPWYSADAIVDLGGVPSIWQSKPIDATSVVYNAVAQTTLPPDSTLLGLDAARLPPDGKALIYRVGMLALVHHTAALAVSTLTAGQVIDCGRVRLYRVVIEDSTGQRLPADAYTVDRVLGLVTLADPLDQTGYTPPWTVHHTIADLGRIRETDISGRLTFLRALSHDYPADDSLVSGVIYAGTLQARVSNVFAQSTWTSVWADALIGAAPLAQFNDTLYPIAVTDGGAYPDRILVQFTSSTAFRVIGEQLGVIAVGDINTDCAPINPAAPVDPSTGQRYPYFTLDHRGWGLGWAVGNCLRFNLHGACYPVDLVRAVQPSDPTGLTDQVELLLIGNVDA